MVAGNDKLSTLQITCSVRSPAIPRLRVLRNRWGYYRNVRFDDS